jgi:hypothetical protein
MIRHLILASGYELTECRLTEIPRGEELTNFSERANCQPCRRALMARGECPACGEKALSWSPHPKKLTQVVDGRLTMNDVTAVFYLACDYCSETLIPEVDLETVARFLTEERWLP